MDERRSRMSLEIGRNWTCDYCGNVMFIKGTIINEYTYAYPEGWIKLDCQGEDKVLHACSSECGIEILRKDRGE